MLTLLSETEVRAGLKDGSFKVESVQFDALEMQRVATIKRIGTARLSGFAGLFQSSTYDVPAVWTER